MPRFADGSPNSQRQYRSILMNGYVSDVENLHCLTSTPDFNRKTSVVVEAHLPVDLCEDRPELTRRHRRAIVLGRDIFHLQNRLLPSIGVAAAVQGNEGAGLHFGDVIAGLNNAIAVLD